MELAATKNDIYGNRQKPELDPIQEGFIPLSLKDKPYWVCWDLVWDSSREKWTKVPKNVSTGNNASSTNHRTWCDYESAIQAYRDGRFDGIGFVLGDEIIGIDLDDCIVEAGPTPLAKDIISRADTYTEVSPSGTGVKMFVLADLGTGHRTKNSEGTIEVYSTGRFFCVTGNRFGDQSEVQPRQSEVEGIFEDYIGSEVRKSIETGSEGRVNYACRDAMILIEPKSGENDGSNRLFTYACRAVGHNLSDSDAVATVRAAAETHPFPIDLSDEDILRRVHEAESRDDVIRGSEITIRVGNDPTPVIEKTVEALRFNTNVYQNGNAQLTRYVENPEPCKFATKDNGSPRLQPIPAGAMLETLAQSATFQRYQKDGWVNTWPTVDLRNAIRDRGHYPGLQVVNGVVSSPILLPDGGIITTPGYHADTGLILNIDDKWPSFLMDNPTALERLSYVFKDFPFASESNQSACFAALLTHLGRNVIDGNTPFFAFDGNRPGCGKGLATDVIMMIAEGRRATRYTYSGNQEELAKMLVALAIEGRNYVLFDNIEGRFGDPVLEAAMTSGRISGRVLKSSKSIDQPLTVTWIGTCNGMTYHRDMLRRTVPIFLDTDREDPHRRDDFKEPDLLGFVSKNRKELLIAGLSILANYIRSGQTVEVGTFGSFENWSKLVRGALIYAEMPDPCDSCTELDDQLSQGVSSDANALLDAWNFKEPVTVSKAVELCQENPIGHNRLHDLLKGKPGEVTDSEHLGKLLRSARASGHFDRTATKRAKWFKVSRDANG